MPPSKKHIQLSDLTLRWLSARSTGKGIRWAREVRLGEEYVADAVALGRMQRRYEKCLLPKFDSISEQQEWWSNYRYGWVFVFEVKVSRSDLLSTFNGDGPRYDPAGHLHYCVTPPDLVEPEELPQWWGLIEQSGLGLRVAFHPEIRHIEDEQAWWAAHQVLWAGEKTRQQKRREVLTSFGPAEVE